MKDFRSCKLPLNMSDVAKVCAVFSRGKGLTLTGQLDLRMEILTGEDLEPTTEVLETLGKGSVFQVHDGLIPH